jgi:hypothetical protein
VLRYILHTVNIKFLYLTLNIILHKKVNCNSIFAKNQKNFYFLENMHKKSIVKCTICTNYIFYIFMHYYMHICTSTSAPNPTGGLPRVIAQPRARRPATRQMPSRAPSRAEGRRRGNNLVGKKKRGKIYFPLSYQS